VLYTAKRLIAFGYDILRPVFVVMGLNLLNIYSFPALLLPAFSLGFSLSCFEFLRFVLVFFPVMFYLVFRVMNFVQCQGFLCISSMYTSLLFGCPITIFPFIMFSHLLLCAFLPPHFWCPFFFFPSSPLFLSASGVHMAYLLHLLVVMLLLLCSLSCVFPPSSLCCAVICSQGWGSIPQRVWRAGAPLFEAAPAL